MSGAGCFDDENRFNTLHKQFGYVPIFLNMCPKRRKTTNAIVIMKKSESGKLRLGDLLARNSQDELLNIESILR